MRLGMEKSYLQEDDSKLAKGGIDKGAEHTTGPHDRGQRT